MTDVSVGFFYVFPGPTDKATARRLGKAICIEYLPQTRYTWHGNCFGKGVIPNTGAFMNSILKPVIALLLGCGACATASAAIESVSWSMTGSGQASSWTFSNGGHTAEVSAYYTANNNGSGLLGNALVTKWSGGLGVRNPVDSNENGSPNHATDTSGKNDLLFFAFDAMFRPESFRLGWWEGDSDVQVWIGSSGAAMASSLSLSGACVVGCVNSLTSLGFTALPLMANAKLDLQSFSLAPAVETRYLIFSGDFKELPSSDRNQLGLSGDNNRDYFKLQTLSGSFRTPEISLLQTVPEPGSMMLLGMGFAAMLFGARRRRAS